MNEWIELLTSKSVLGAVAGLLIALNQRYQWIAISEEDLIVLVGVVATVIVAAMRRAIQKAEKAAEKAGQKAEDGVTMAADLAAEKAVRACQ